MEEIYKELQKLGFSQYECKAYINLLKNSPVTGYEVSKRSGVPRSMIYEVLGKLLDKGAIYTVPSEPVKYVPLPAKELIQRMRKSFDESFDFLEKNLLTLENEQETDVIWRVNSDEKVMTEIIEMIDEAQEEVWLSIWNPQAAAVKKVIEKKVSEKIKVFSMLFSEPNTKLGITYHHDFMAHDISEKRMGGHLTIVVRDKEEVLIANFSPDTAAWAVKTKDPALVLVATEYIRHDIAFGELAKEVGIDKVQSFWRNDPDLYYVVTGKRFE
ncbi:helix-turn-helix domain-containing protein [Domibacillus sp. DTU_2020_1001157_1_SI_ALB_TIR_016]|uniref:TrmB family transcriptional regulator n=1 Tax=Domibacillus sp. DTU_2020_1001157_1_SI_ALB_TIR_016 TaxID=3077789 RepID=UPI0028E8B589|nr:helix-turn-helix domain-containing protein [Domibacillus sp. DTU_2020_1001157_1_SI_ALB_TIR_016]WNS78049.1 helix-turn-helix domain-containing protein [Domibacillus sp. DTU_2020_1001157_1_SI_ALB_TIR_016]